MAAVQESRLRSKCGIYCPCSPGHRTWVVTTVQEDEVSESTSTASHLLYHWETEAADSVYNDPKLTVSYSRAYSLGDPMSETFSPLQNCPPSGELGSLIVTPRWSESGV